MRLPKPHLETVRGEVAFEGVYFSYAPVEVAEGQARAVGADRFITRLPGGYASRSRSGAPR